MDQDTGAQAPSQAQCLALKQAEIQRLKTVNQSLQEQIRQYQQILADHGLSFSGIGTVLGGYPAAHDLFSMQTTAPIMTEYGPALSYATTSGGPSSIQQSLPFTNMFTEYQIGPANPAKRKKTDDSPSISPPLAPPSQVAAPLQLHSLQATNNKTITSEGKHLGDMYTTVSNKPSLEFNRNQMTGAGQKSSGTLSTAPSTKTKNCQIEGPVSKRHPSFNNEENTGTFHTAHTSPTITTGNTQVNTDMGATLKPTNPVEQESGGGSVAALRTSANANTLRQPQAAPNQSTFPNNYPMMPSLSNQGAQNGATMRASALIKEILSQQGQTQSNGQGGVQPTAVHKPAPFPGSWCQTSGLPAPTVDCQNIARVWAGNRTLGTGGITTATAMSVTKDQEAMQPPSFTGHGAMPSTYTTVNAPAANPQVTGIQRGPTSQPPASRFLHNTETYVTTSQMAKKTKRKKSGRPNRAWVFAYTFPSSECALYILVCPSHGCDVLHKHPLLHNRGLEHIRGHGVIVADVEEMVRQYGCQVINEKHPLTIEWARQWNEDILQDSGEMHLQHENFQIIYPTKKAK